MHVDVVGSDVYNPAMARLLSNNEFLRLEVHAYYHGKTVISTWWNGTPMHNEFWRLYYNEQPGVVFRSLQGDMHVPARRLVLVPPRFHGVGLVQGSVDHAFMHFDVTGFPLGLISQLIPLPIELPFSPPLQALCDSWLASLAQQSREEIHSLSAYLRVESMASQAMALCWEIAQAEKHPAWIAWRKGFFRLASLNAWINTHLDQDLSIGVLAARCGYSPDHFRRLFQPVFGMTPAAYVTLLRVKEAARLLIFETASMEEIAERTGFVDRHHFSRVFRLTTGTPPASYRRRNQIPSAV